MIPQTFPRVFQVICGVVLLTLADRVMCQDSSSQAQSCPVTTNGCSIPGDLPFFFKNLFTPVCDKHDICYYCGQMHGWSRSDCDTAFKNDMYGRCKVYAASKKRGLGDVWNWVKSLFKSKLHRCKAMADVYHLSVDKFGASYYEKISPSWCNSSCVLPLGKP